VKKVYKVKLNYAGPVVITVKEEAKSVGQAIDAAIALLDISEELLVKVSVKDIDLSE